MNLLKGLASIMIYWSSLSLKIQAKLGSSVPKSEALLPVDDESSANIFSWRT